ncbi:MAG: PAS domain S-box protein, partial [Desulfovibrionaceae bacterium]
IVRSADLAPYGVFVFILAYSFFVSKRFAQTHADMERFSRMLDAQEEAIIAVDRNKDVCFCNQAFARRLGLEPADLTGRRFAELLKDPQTHKDLLEALPDAGVLQEEGCVFEDVRFICKNGGDVAANLSVSAVELDEGPIALVLARKPGGEDAREAALFSAAMLRELKAKRRRLLHLEEAVQARTFVDPRKRKAVLDDIKALDSLLHRLGRRAPEKTEDGEKRRLAVTVMNLAVDCWSAATGGSKADLAEQSRIWNVYLEKDGYCRTQTLDKYLNLDTLPQRPRWRDVYATAEFVLSRLDAGTHGWEQLWQAYADLKACS